MASLTFLGTAPAIKKKSSWTFGGTWESTDVVVLTIGTVAVSVVAGSTTISTILTNVLAALDALDDDAYPQFAEIDFTVDSTKLYAEAATAGASFDLTVTTTETGGGAADSQTIGSETTVTAHSSPNDWSIAANWSGGAVPVNSDDVTIPGTAPAITMGLSQSGVTLASLSIYGDAKLGRPVQNPAGYAEFRGTELAIGATTVTINSTSSLIRLNLGSAQSAVTVMNTGNSSERGRAACAIRGTHASNTLDVRKGSVESAMLVGYTATWANIYQSGGTLDLSANCTITNITRTGGEITVRSATTSLRQEDGKATILAATQTAVTMNGGRLNYHSPDNITTLTVNEGAVVDCDGGSMDAATFGTVNLNKGMIIDSVDRISITTLNWTGKLQVVR